MRGRILGDPAGLAELACQFKDAETVSVFQDAELASGFQNDDLPSEKWEVSTKGVGQEQMSWKTYLILLPLSFSLFLWLGSLLQLLCDVLVLFYFTLL